MESALPNSEDRPVVVIVGPTAVGKTAVAIELVELLSGAAEIISADSVQVYRKLDIGSAKPTAHERLRARFHAIDLVDPDQDFTVADYQDSAIVAVDAIQSRGNLPILCGGTGLYIKALTQPMGIPHVEPDEDLRQSWMEYLDVNGPGSLHKVLIERDPATAERLHVNDARRIIRALEVLEKTGVRLSQWHSEDSSQGKALLDNCRFIGLTSDRQKLVERIDQRVDSMILAGFVHEVRSLRERGYDDNLKSMQSLGYKELNAELAGRISHEEAAAQIKLRTRQFARRQMIWFRAEKRIDWLDVDRMEAGETAKTISDRFNLLTSAS